MDNLKCNRLTCRRTLTEKAVVTTCSHIFCVECANELFNASRLCPACETSLPEPDDVVVCSLHPSNDYKTSVLSGLNPTIILEICSRAMSFWQYQVHQEHSFQQAVTRNVNEKNAQLQKQLDNVIREANGEISLLNNKVAEIERDLELERRKAAGLQDSMKERDKEYQKLKAQYDKLKRKTLLAPNALGGDQGGGENPTGERPALGEQLNKIRPGMAFGAGAGGALDVGAVVGDMEANGIQRTPIVNRTMGTSGSAWRQPNPAHARHNPQRQPFNANADRSFRTATTRSDHSADSANEVENLLGQSRQPMRNNTVIWSAPQAQARSSRPVQRGFAQPPTKRSSGQFRPAVPQ
ncbi:hypothetical protein B0H21DRAFT_754610 [Amylocystis lapponica]|nr:hypothetical protein B0H21DRAFT_754610 [Amylocystis lapponica]